MKNENIVEVGDWIVYKKYRLRGIKCGIWFLVKYIGFNHFCGNQYADNNGNKI